MPYPSLDSSLVRILTDDHEPRRPEGAGFLVTPKHILTCAHVVNAALGRNLNAADQPSSASEVFLDFPLLNNHCLLRAKILHWFPVADAPATDATGTTGTLEDIAVLELLPETPLPAEARPAPLVALDSSPSFTDHRLRMCGFPGGVDQGTYIDGMLKGRTGAGFWEIHPLDKTRPIEQGFSGTAVWAVQENAVCGMISSRLRRKPDQENGPVITGYMLPASALIRAFPELDQHSRPANPYRGLEAFREKDANLYFGRDNTINRLRQVVADRPFAAVIGASGSGKSSVVFAGLLPALRKSGDWLVAHCRPKKQPLYELAACLIPLLYDDPILRSEKTDELKEKLHAGSVGLTGIIRQIKERREQHENLHLLLVIDQFEELFTLNTDQELIRQYIGILLECLHTEQFTVLLTMRADFFAAAVSSPALAEALDNSAPIILPQIDEQGLREVVEQPANVLGVYFEPGLTDLIVSDVGKEPGSLPLLEFCLTQLWERQEFRRISHEAYKAIGGVQQALANHADAVYAEFDEQEREQLRHIFLKLVRPGQGTEDTRQVATVGQIQPEYRGLITRLADKRLIVTGRDEERGEETVEVVHEALIRRWQTLRQWVDDKDQEKQRKRNIRALVLGLIAAVLLSVFVGWQWRKAEQQILKANHNLANAFEERALNALKISDNKKAVLFTSAAFKQKIEMDKTALKASSTGILFTPEIFNAALAEQILIEGHKGLVNSAAFSPDGKTIVSAATSYYNSCDNSVRIWKAATGKQLAILKGHESGVNSAVFSPDGKKIVSASDDKTVRIWETKTGKQLTVIKGHENHINSVAFSPDGKKIVSASDDKTVRIWEAKTGKQLANLEGHENDVNSAGFSPDGKKIVSAGGSSYNSYDNSVRIWDATSGKQLALLKGHRGPINCATFSPDGKKIVSAGGSSYDSYDNSVRIWDAVSGKQLALLKGHESPVNSVAFSPDGKKIVSASGSFDDSYDKSSLYDKFFNSHDNSVRIWEAASGKQLTVINRYEHDVTTAAFSPDGKTIVSASGDSVQVLDAASDKELAILKMQNSVLCFSPDGKTIVSVASFYNMRTWEAKTGKELALLKGHEGNVTSAAFSPDSKTIVSASRDRTVRIWEAKTGKQLALLKGHKNDVNSAAFSPDGKTIVSASWDRTVRTWNAKTGKQQFLPKGHETGVRSAAFSPSGKTIVSIPFDNTVRIWNTKSSRQRFLIRGHGAYVLSTVLSTDGKITVVSVSADNTVRIRDAASDKELVVLKGHTGTVNSVAFSPDGKTIVSTSGYFLDVPYDNTVRIWDAKTGKELALLNMDESPSENVIFSPDGKTFSYDSNDGTIRFWNLRPLTLFLDNSKPTPLYHTFIEAVKFLWQLDVQGLDIVETKRRTPADLKNTAPYSPLRPPAKVNSTKSWNGPRSSRGSKQSLIHSAMRPTSAL